tara:strand:- start:4405 stop:5139 length:735 start_codon:yes stop_codon:yes gene_type:complete
MAVKFKINKAIESFKNEGGTTGFPDSLRDVLRFIQNDPKINTKKEVAWLLATAKVESDYSLSRWESDFLCGKIGVAYKQEPCQRAINYYRSSDGKRNYFDLGTDNNGMAYFGRGLIQLTGKENYKTYGKEIGVDLLGDGDKALIPKNSYNIASAYFKKRKVYQYANEENFPMARKAVKGSTKDWEVAKKEYDKWINVLDNNEIKFKDVKVIKKERITRVILYSGVFLAVVGFAVGFSLLTRTKK